MKNCVFTFPSGLRMAHFENTAVRSVALGVHFGVGSSNECPENNGISHFIEHMMFKGTDKRSALDIVSDLESNGINVNAFTSKMNTCFYTISTDDEVEHCFEVLSDILLHSTFSEEEMSKEKGVILEEISISEDDPADLCLDMMAGAYYGDNALGMTILGSRENVSNFTHADVAKYYHDHYLANNCVIAVSGNISFDDAKALVEKYFEGNLRTDNDYKWKDEPCAIGSNYVYKYKDVEQANIGIAFKGYSINDDKGVEMEIISSILGGGMSSRLFQTIREKMGLAYSVYTYVSTTINNGYFVVSLSTNKESLKKSIKATRQEIDRLVKDGITREEFERAKKLTKAGYIIGSESTSAIMRVSGKYTLCRDKAFSLDELVERVENVSFEDVNACIKEIFNYDHVNMAYVGREIDFDALKAFKE